MNRFDYAEICPTCRDAGIIGEDGKPVSLGFDIDTSTICCVMGHEFDALPSEQKGLATVAEQSDTVSSDPATVASIRNAENDASGAASSEVFCHTLDPVSAVDDVASAQADSAALAQLSQRIEGGISVKVETLTPEAREVADVPADAIGLRLAPIALAPENRRYWVGPGGSMTLPNGDLLLGQRIPEQWRQAIEAEADNQRKSPADYLSSWLTSDEMQSAIVDALVSYWSSAYSQTVAGSPR